MEGLATRKAPPAWLPLRYMVAGMAAFLLLHGLLAWQGDTILGGLTTAPLTLAAVHLAAVGWGTLVLMGALYQLVPVLLNADLHSHALGRAGFWPAVGGAGMLVGGFWAWQPALVAAGGILVAVAALLLAYNLLRSIPPAARLALHGRGLLGAVAFFLLTVAWGLGLAGHLLWGYLDAMPRQVAVHATLGLLGWFSLAIMSAGYRLIPMFTLAHGYSQARQPLTLLALAAGAAMTAALAALGAGPVAVSLPALAVVAAFALFALDMKEILRARRRRRLELVTRFALASLTAGALGATLVWVQSATLAPRWLSGPAGLTATVYLALAGWVSLMMVGQLFKIVPFLIWLDRYSERAGRERVPLVSELFSPLLGELALWGLVTGTFGTALAVLSGQPGLARATEAVAFLGALAFGGAMAQVILGLRVIPRQGSPVPGKGV